jgi:hypothetical protein
VVGDRAATSGEVIVGSMLILIGAALIALTCCLVVIRPDLILIASRLVVVAHGLVAVARGLVAGARGVFMQLIDRAGQKLGAAGRAPRNPGRLTAGWTVHDLCHHPLLIPERALRRTSKASTASPTRTNLLDPH